MSFLVDFVCLSVCLPACLPACLSVCLSTWLSACLIKPFSTNFLIRDSKEFKASKSDVAPLIGFAFHLEEKIIRRVKNKGP